MSDDYIAYRAKLLSKLSKLQHMSDGHYGRIKAAKHRFELISSDKRPINSAPYRAVPCAREFEKYEIDKMLATDVTEPAQTEKVSSIGFVPEKDGTLRLCLYNCKLNAVTTQHSYPITRMDQCIESLVDSTISFTLDDSSRY